jgi:putative transposase
MKELSMTIDPAEAVAIRQYALIADAANPRLTSRERGRIVRELAARVHEHPDGSDRVVYRGTVDRWLRAYNRPGPGGPEAQASRRRRRRRCYSELVQEAAALRVEPRPYKDLG